GSALEKTLRVTEALTAFGERSRLLTLRYIRAVHEAIRAAHRQSGHHAAAWLPERQETAPQMTERPAQRTPNRQLAALIAEAGFSNAGLARRVDQLGLEHGLDLRLDGLLRFDGPPAGQAAGPCPW
ncbi:hypothetical protein ABT024_40660, partial [Streptomyces sp. NPDC002812]|uniref:hypothetical protein n=1 Tax=Streptomyces sp. NPDC002812 TaxID=3154434 RepID=UPI003323EF5E